MLKAIGCILVVALAANSALAAPAPAKPDPALVQRYTDNPGDRDAKIAECKKRNNLVKIMTDVECVSADEAYKAQQRKALQPKREKH